MKDKLKRQKRSIIIKITSIFVAVWLIVSVVFSTAVILIKKEELLNKEDSNFNSLCNSLSNINTTDKHLVSIVVDLYKIPTKYRIKTPYDGLKTPEITCGADGYYDGSVQIKVSLTDEELLIVDELVDSDKIISFSEYGVFESEERKYTLNGSINYDRFIQSITTEQLDSISKYLHSKKDKNGDYYELICKKFYYDEENAEFTPKIVEIVKTNETHTWYAQDEVIETYKLSPQFTDNSKLYTCSPDKRNVIPGQFVLGTFRSNNLIDSYEDYEVSPYYNSDFGNHKRISPFTYLYKDYDYIYVTEHSYEEPQFYGQEDSNTTHYDSYTVKTSVFLVKYAKEFNVLDSCKNTLFIGISAFFLFFLVIGIILTIMMCKMLKTQYTEEQKRVEVSNALAHDIKTPLFIISGFAQNLKENINTDKREHYCDRIIERVGEANDIVHKMLDFSKLNSTDYALEFKDFDVNEYTKELITSFEETDSGKNFILNTNAQCTPYADKVLMQRAISNLVDNAIRYCDENTDIVIDIDEKSFSISNTCKNVLEEDIKHLTEPYYRVEKNRESKGNGLGLSIIKSILDIHGYKLDIKFDNQIITFSILF